MTDRKGGVDIAELRRLVEGATPLPWIWLNGYGPLEDGRMRVLRLGRASDKSPVLDTERDSEDMKIREEDAVFLLSLVNAAPALLAAADFANSMMHGGKWACLTDDGECSSCGATIADDAGELTRPHREDCAFTAYRAAVKP